VSLQTDLPRHIRLILFTTHPIL